MAFTGTAVVEQITDWSVRITGLSLANGDVGTISFDEGTGEVTIGTLPEWQPHGSIPLEAAVMVRTSTVSAESKAPAVQTEKSGSDHSDFLITMTQPVVAETDSGDLEIYLEFR